MMVGEIHGQHSCEVEDYVCLNPMVNYECGILLQFRLNLIIYIGNYTKTSLMKFLTI